MRARRAAAAAAVVATVVAALELPSCVHEPTLEQLATQTVIITQLAPGTNFAAYHTFAITDSIEVTTEGDGGQITTQAAPPSIAAPTLEAIAAEMTARGYRRVARTERPELGVGVLGVVRLSAIVPYGVWWGLGSSSAAFWGYGGSSLATGITSSGIGLWRSGALVIELYDLRAAAAAAASTTPAPIQSSPEQVSISVDSGVPPTIPVIWAAFIYGVLAGADASLPGPPIAGIQQAFAQSPYLTTTP